MNIFVKYRIFIISITLIAIITAGVFTYLKPAEYDTSIAFSINRINKQETEDFQYDGYYAIQASDLFSQTVMSWMMTPSVLLEIYERAGIDPQITSTENFTSRFKARKYSPQNVVIRYRERDEKTAQKIADAIIAIVEEKASAAVQTSDQKAFFEVVGSLPVIVERKPLLWLNLIVGLIGGLLVSVIAAYTIEYLKSSKPEQIKEA